MRYKQYKAEQKILRKTILQTKFRLRTEANTELSLRRLLYTEKEIKTTLAFLKEIKIATRKWISENIEKENKIIKEDNIDREI